MDDSFFNEFFGGLFSGNSKQQEEELNKLYWSDPQKYLQKIDRMKSLGYRILRNSKGKHKVEFKNAH